MCIPSIDVYMSILLSENYISYHSDNGSRGGLSGGRRLGEQQDQQDSVQRGVAGGVRSVQAGLYWELYHISTIGRPLDAGQSRMLEDGLQGKSGPSSHVISRDASQGITKWRAWDGKKGMGQDEAKQKYIDLANQLRDKHGAQ